MAAERRIDDTDNIDRLADLIERASIAHHSGQYDVARELIREAKQLVKIIDPDLVPPEIC